MNDDLHFIDIVFFAMVAAFLILRLRSVLGRRTGNERPPRDWGAKGGPAATPDNVIDLASARKPASEPIPEGPAAAGLMDIRAADPGFSVADFLSGSKAAFAMVVEAYARGEKKVLRPLLSDDVYGGFAAAIDSREQAGEVLDTELIGIRAATIVAARMNGSMAEVTVRFRSDQVNLIKDSEGRIVEGDPERVAEVIDEWTFARDTRSADPNWHLVATRAPEDGETA